METNELYVLVGLLLNFGAMIGGAVFVVASVKATTAVLTVQVKSLHYAIDKLTNLHDRLDNKIDHHAERLTRLEAHANSNELKFSESVE